MEVIGDLSTYKGDTEHDMWVDYSTHIHIDTEKEIEEIFAEPDIDEFINNLNDWD